MDTLKKDDIKTIIDNIKMINANINRDIKYVTSLHNKIYNNLRQKLQLALDESIIIEDQLTSYLNTYDEE